MTCRCSVVSSASASRTSPWPYAYRCPCTGLGPLSGLSSMMFIAPGLHSPQVMGRCEHREQPWPDVSAVAFYNLWCRHAGSRVSWTMFPRAMGVCPSVSWSRTASAGPLIRLNCSSTRRCLVRPLAGPAAFASYQYEVLCGRLVMNPSCLSPAEALSASLLPSWSLTPMRGAGENHDRELRSSDKSRPQ